MSRAKKRAEFHTGSAREAAQELVEVRDDLDGEHQPLAHRELSDLFTGVPHRLSRGQRTGKPRCREPGVLPRT